MPELTSTRACDKCRERRVKCDKTIPSCQRCKKLGQPCPGYDKKRKFVDEGITLRKKFEFDDGLRDGTPSKHSDRAVKNSLSSAVAALGNSTSTSTPVNLVNTVAQNHVGALGLGLSSNAAFQPQHEISVEPANRLADQLPASSLWQFDQGIDETWNEGDFDPEWFNLDPEIYYGRTGEGCGFLPHTLDIVDEVDREVYDMATDSNVISPPLSTGHPTMAESSTLWAPESQFSTSARITDDREHEMAFLVRHFTESVGPWMDIYDKQNHFTQLVPLKALKDALLRNAVAAVSAKQLGRTQGKRSTLEPQAHRASALESVDNVLTVDWFYKAANYYDKAIAFSRQYLQAVSASASGGTDNAESARRLSAAKSEDLLVAVSLFSLYENLDDLDIGWLQHLVGFKTLLTNLDAGAQALTPAPSALSAGRLASFWNFVRADYQAAYINHQKTFLDVDELSLWHCCGLQVQSDGTLYANPQLIKTDTTYAVDLAQLVAHTLLWLVLRVMNYLVAGNNPDLTPTQVNAQWQHLTSQFDAWYHHLPPSFQPCAQVRHRAPAPMQSSSSSWQRSTSSRLIEVFYSIDICAAALQLYHFARILLLLHQPLTPHGSTKTTGGRLGAYREVSGEAINHAHQILGIALGRPSPSIRVEMLLPLHLAGSCLESDEERKLALDLLRAIEKDTGCATERRCLELVKGWGWVEDPTGVT